MNVEFARRVKEQILAEPHRVNMKWYLVDEGCGTVGCIAGHACSLAGISAEYQRDHKIDIEAYASQVLWMTKKQIGQLFYFPFYNPGLVLEPGFDTLRNKISMLKPMSPEYAAVVAEAIDLAIELWGPRVEIAAENEQVLEEVFA